MQLRDLPGSFVNIRARGSWTCFLDEDDFCRFVGILLIVGMLMGIFSRVGGESSCELRPARQVRTPTVVRKIHEETNEIYNPG